MSSTMTAAEALSRVPGWDGNGIVCTELQGGLTNRNYRVEREERCYVLRLDAEHTHLFGLDRPRELAILEQAADAGLAPEIIFSDTGAGILLSAYVPGRIWDPSDLDDHENIEALSALIHEVHALPTCGSAFDAGRMARRYVQNLAADDKLLAFGARCQAIIDDIEASGVTCCCHNDLVAENVISASRLMLLDWEYACDNDPLFDLATLISFHELSDKKARDLLSAYAGGASPEQVELLEEQVRLYDAIQWLWFASRQTITRTTEQATRLEKLKERLR